MKRHFTWQINTKVCRPDHLWHLQNFATSSFMRSITKVGVEAMYSFFTISLTLKKWEKKKKVNTKITPDHQCSEFWNPKCTWIALPACRKSSGQRRLCLHRGWRQWAAGSRRCPWHCTGLEAESAAYKMKEPPRYPSKKKGNWTEYHHLYDNAYQICNVAIMKLLGSKIYFTVPSAWLWVTCKYWTATYSH